MTSYKLKKRQEKVAYYQMHPEEAAYSQLRYLTDEQKAERKDQQRLKYLAIQRKKYKTKHFQEVRQAYKEKNKEKLIKQRKMNYAANRNKYLERNHKAQHDPIQIQKRTERNRKYREILSDGYIKKCIQNSYSNGSKLKYNEIPQKLIDLFRLQILLRRKRKEIYGKNGMCRHDNSHRFRVPYT